MYTGVSEQFQTNFGNFRYFCFFFILISIIEIDFFFRTLHKILSTVFYFLVYTMYIKFLF